MIRNIIGLIRGISLDVILSYSDIVNALSKSLKRHAVDCVMYVMIESQKELDDINNGN